MAIWDRIFADRIKKYVAWKNYETGFSGVGTTALDIQPPFDKPWLPVFISNAIDRESEAWAKIKHETFRQSFLEVTGEDIDEDYLE